MTGKKLRGDALAIFQAALRAADAGNAVLNHMHLLERELRAKKFHRAFLLAVGKAALSMAEAVLSKLNRPLDGGIIVTKHGHLTRPIKGLQCLESGHPIPDERGLEAAQLIEQMLAKLDERDILICAISGGASALLPAPVYGLTLEQKQRTTDLLLRAGANIHELNAVRKHLSRLKGGRLAALAYPATVVTLLLSDVIRDDPSVIGSGLTAPDPSTIEDAKAIMQKFGLRLPAVASETPKAGDPVFKNVHNIIVGSNRLALSAAKKKARERGYRTVILSSSIEGETREVARTHAELLLEMKRPCCVLSGGETTVLVRGHGKGGRNQEFALAASLYIARRIGTLVLSAGTDGTDGPTDAAGAIATDTTLRRAGKLGLDARDYLDRNDSYPFFDRLGDLIKTGPTGTNVMDVHLLLAG